MRVLEEGGNEERKKRNLVGDCSAAWLLKIDDDEGGERVLVSYGSEERVLVS